VHATIPGLFVEIGLVNTLSQPTSNHDPPDLHLPNSLDYNKCEPGQQMSFLKEKGNGVLKMAFRKG
jgi:hypothetical protein